MKSTKAAGRYAKVLLELAIEQNKVDSVLGDMQFLTKTSEETREFALLIASPIIHPDKKISIFELVFEQFEEVSLDFIRLITKNRREGELPNIATTFEALVKEHKGIVPITVYTAAPMDAGTRQLLVDKIQASVKGTLEVTEKIDESLIGGFVVRMGDVRIDASVSSQFNSLKQRLTR